MAVENPTFQKDPYHGGHRPTVVVEIAHDWKVPTTPDTYGQYVDSLGNKPVLTPTEAFQPQEPGKLSKTPDNLDPQTVAVRKAVKARATGRTRAI